MSVQGTSRRSAAYLLLFLAMTFFVGGLTITLINPYWNDLENSKLFAFGTPWWTDFANWTAEIHAQLGLVLLVSILVTAFIATRDPV